MRFQADFGPIVEPSPLPFLFSSVFLHSLYNYKQVDLQTSFERQIEVSINFLLIST